MVNIQGEVFRRNHLIRLAESIKRKQPIVTFPKNDRNFYCYVYPIKFTLKIFSSIEIFRDK